MIDPSLYSWHISDASAIALIVALIAAITLICIVVPRLRLIYSRSLEDAEAGIPGELPGVSVIISSHSRPDLLLPFVEDIYNQAYPAPLEVIIVNSEGEEYMADNIKMLQARFPKLKSTFVPSGSRNLSRRKLAITLGIKAATQPIVLLTCGNCRAEGDGWISAMMRHFAEGADVVIGSTAMRDIDGDKGIGPMRSFDSLISAMRRLPAAISGKPVGADCCNLAYRRHLFFDCGGFSHTLNLNYGDDDIFVSELAKGNIVEAELSPDSILYTCEPSPRKIYDIERANRVFTSDRLRRGPFILTSFTNLLWWIFLAAGVVATVAGLPSLLPVAAVILMFIGLSWPISSAAGKAAAVLKIQYKAWTTPFRWIAYPLFLLHYKIGCSRKIRNFTWEN